MQPFCLVYLLKELKKGCNLSYFISTELHLQVLRIMLKKQAANPLDSYVKNTISKVYKLHIINMKE